MTAPKLILAGGILACAALSPMMADNPALQLVEGMWKWETVSRSTTVTGVVWIRPCPPGPRAGKQAGTAFLVLQSPVRDAPIECMGVIPLGTNQMVITYRPQIPDGPNGVFVGAITMQIDGRVTAAKLSLLPGTEGAEVTLMVTYLGR